jgi:catechol 2,3-dioxygenase-like lactoylglutathione lyase family enzyme
MEAAKMQTDNSVDMKLEVILLEVADVNRSKKFYEDLGWRVDADFASGESDFHIVQVTPPHSGASIIFGKGVSPAGRVSSANLVLAVNDIAAAREDLSVRGVDVSDVFHFAQGPFNDSGEASRIPGPDEEGRPYYSFVSFDDPDGNQWLVQEISTRLPGREWDEPQDDASLAELLHEAEQRHGQYESSHGKHNWWDWYAPYVNARQNGKSPEEAAAAADRRMDEAFQIPAR